MFDKKVQKIIYYNSSPTEMELRPNDRSFFFIENKKYFGNEKEKTWGIYDKFGYAYSREKTWDYEPIPSSRTEEWFFQHRFSFEEATEIAEKIAKESWSEK